MHARVARLHQALRVQKKPAPEGAGFFALAWITGPSRMP